MKREFSLSIYSGASGRTRTVTSKTLEPKSSASTNFATGAECAAGEGGGTDMETTVQPKPS